MTYGGGFRFCIEDVHGEILARDVKPNGNIQVLQMLSGPSQIQFDILPKNKYIQSPDGTGPIQLKPWGHWIHAIKDGPEDEIIAASGLMQPSDIDPQTSMLSVRAEGFSNYAREIPWLQNWNPITADPFEVVTHIWDHLQSYEHGNLGIEIYPSSSGTQMLPGFSFNNEEFIQNLFALVIREADQRDCGDYINKLARDIPFDYFEESTWNEDKSAINKKIRLGYPQGGTIQDGLLFELGTNVFGFTPKTASQVEWFSDVVLSGYFPSQVYSVMLSNADPDRYRRVMKETDLHIDSQERGAAWAHRLLTRRQVPHQFDNLLVQEYHSNAPFNLYNVGDTITVKGPMPWVSNSYSQPHRIMSRSWDEGKPGVQLKVMADTAFNYDPIEYLGG